MAEQIQQAHALYCELTGQKLRLAYDRERAWYELLQAGFTLEDVRAVIRYLQKEIRHERRNVGALKLSNLRVDQFEEDLHISHVRLQPSPAPQSSPPEEPPASVLTPEEQARKREAIARHLAQLRASLRLGASPETNR
jgi:hypothetical protein